MLGLRANVGNSSQPYWTQLFRFHPVVETIARLNNAVINFTGTVRECGAGKTYATITAAYAAATSGDIIQLYDATYDTFSEAGGYLSLATAGKRILIRGNAADRTACAIVQTHDLEMYNIRLEDCGETVFQNLSFISNGKRTFTENSNVANRILIFDNCVLTNTSALTTSYVMGSSNTLNNGTRWIEFKNCTFNGGTGNDFGMYSCTTQGIGTQVLFTNCILNSQARYSLYPRSNNTCKWAMYDCTINHDHSSNALQFGENSVAETNNLGLIDVRTCVINIAAGHYGHAIMMGRGVVNYYCVNNQVNGTEVAQAGNMGIVLEAIGSDITKCIFRGNRVSNRKAILLKGASYNDISDNIFITRSGTVSAMAFNNWKITGDINVRNNKIENNIAFGVDYMLSTVNDGSAEDVVTSLKTGTFNNNKYYSLNAHYVSDAVLGNVEWSGKAAYWGNSFDINSKFEIGKDVSEIP